MTLMRMVVLVVRFLSELGALLAFTLWGFHEAGWFGILPPLAAAAIWGRWMAPRSETRLGDPKRLIAELFFFGAAASAFAAAEGAGCRNDLRRDRDRMCRAGPLRG